ncbi:MAG TPA: penicillin-binding protein 2, partial [Aliiroseovarius sp.]|nr:penicillin-binding protein 2 [Aliiroseovarius sp.]
YEVAQRVGIEKISEMARELGLGYKHELPISGVARGLAPTKDWKREHRGGEWLIGDTINAGIGQGYVLASPLQLAIMTARISTGRQITPRLIRSLDGVEVPVEEAPPLNIPQEHLAIMRQGMYEVVYGQRATAGRSKILAEDKKLAGKTGTSQVRRITKAEREAGVTKNEDLPWDRRDHALFVCYAPYDAPKYSVSVVAEHGGGGSKAAAPIARDIILYALYGELPPLEAYPSAQRREIRDRFARLDLRAPGEPTQGRGRA